MKCEMFVAVSFGLLMSMSGTVSGSVATPAPTEEEECVETIEITSVTWQDPSIDTSCYEGDYVFSSIDDNGYPIYIKEGSNEEIYFAPISDIPQGTIRLEGCIGTFNSPIAYSSTATNDVEFFDNYIEVDDLNLFNGEANGGLPTQWAINNAGFGDVTGILNDCPQQGLDFV